MNAFAHLHPVPRTPHAQDFDVTLPPLPQGRYRVYGDIVHESGYAQTLTASVNVGAEAGNVQAGPADNDDSWFTGAPLAGHPAYVATLEDGVSIEWQPGPEPMVAGAERLLTFSARDRNGQPLSLEPYMGMMGHVIVTHEDGSVFAHLHPGGSISMAALERFTRRDAIPSAHHMPDEGGPLSIPYAFPRPGPYRMWVQVKHEGRVVTAAFRVDVAPAK
jgi:hypothetical protein